MLMTDGRLYFPDEHRAGLKLVEENEWLGKEINSIWRTLMNSKRENVEKSISQLQAGPWCKTLAEATEMKVTSTENHADANPQKSLNEEIAVLGKWNHTE